MAIVTFRSTATESIVMFRDVAVALLRMLGASGHVPGALSAEDVPAAIASLEANITRLIDQQKNETPAPPAVNEDSSAEDDEQVEPPISLATRAAPLISMLKRAAAAKAEVMWEGNP